MNGGDDEHQGRAPRELPDEVVAALNAGRKVEAIKLLRSAEGLDLKEAKDRVEAYLATRPEFSRPSVVERDPSMGRLVLIAIIAVVAYLAYRYMTG